MSPELTFT